MKFSFFTIQQLKFLQYGSLLVGIILIAFCFFCINGQFVVNKNQKYDITYGGKLRQEKNGAVVLSSFDCSTFSFKDETEQECKILVATHGLAITSIVFGSVALLLIILRDYILKEVYYANKKIGFIIVLGLIFIPLLFTIMMPMWKLVNNNQYLTYKFFPVFLEFISFFAYATAFSIEIYQGVNNKNQDGLLY